MTWRRASGASSGVTLVETVVSMVVIIIGLAGLFLSSAQSYALLRRSKEIVAVREDLLARLDALRVLSYTELAQSSYVSSSVMESGTSGDATPFGMTTKGMRSFSETVTVYALGWQLFSSDSARVNATPDVSGEYASEINTSAPAPPVTYRSSSTTKGDWAVQVANALPYYTITRVGTGASAVTTVTNTGLTSGNLTAYPQLRVDVTYSWTDANNVTRTQVGSIIISKSGSLP